MFKNMKHTSHYLIFFFSLALLTSGCKSTAIGDEKEAKKGFPLSKLNVGEYPSSMGADNVGVAFGRPDSTWYVANSLNCYPEVDSVEFRQYSGLRYYVLGDQAYFYRAYLEHPREPIINIPGLALTDTTTLTHLSEFYPKETSEGFPWAEGTNRYVLVRLPIKDERDTELFLTYRNNYLSIVELWWNCSKANQ